MTKRTIKSPKGLLTDEILAWGDPRNPLRADPQEAIKGYIGFWREWACMIIKYEGGDPARYYEILSERKNLRDDPIPVGSEQDPRISATW